MSEQMREIGRTARAFERIVEWVAEARPEAAAALAVARPARDLAHARRRLATAAEQLVRADRERAIEEADIALVQSDRGRGDVALIAALVHAALQRALDGVGAPPPAIAVARGVRLQVIA